MDASNVWREPAEDSRLADEVIELRLLRVLKPGDVAARPSAARFLSQVPEYRFAIHRRSDGLRVGRIHLRVTDDETVLRTLGHTGYAVDEAHRRHGYATRALRLIVQLARRHGIAPLWVLIEPENAASRRTAEKAGFQLVDIVHTQPPAMQLGIGPRVCRYVIEQP
jgi:tagatose 1,6-diphosphate aldolase